MNEEAKPNVQLAPDRPALPHQRGEHIAFTPAMPSEERIHQLCNALQQELAEYKRTEAQLIAMLV